MKSLTYILKNLITDRIIAVTSLVALMLCASSVVQADYFMYGGSDNYTSWTDNAVASGSSPTFSISINATTGRNYFVAYTGASADYNNISTDNGVSVTNSGCSTCSNAQRQEWGSKYFALFSVSSASTVTVTFNTSTLAYTVSSGSAPVEYYYACGSQIDVFGDDWCTDDPCPTDNALTLSGGYYTKTYRKIENLVDFKLHNSSAYINNCYDSNSPTNLNGVTEYEPTYPDNNMQLTGAKNSSGQNKQTSFDLTIKYDATNNKTYLITTPYIFFKGPIFNKGNWDDDYGASCWEWTDISKVGDNWVFTYDWTINSTGLGTKLFSICTTTNESSGFKLPDYTSIDLTGVERDEGTYNNYKPTISIREGDDLRLRVTRRGPEDYKVELINLDVSTPVARIGKKLTEVTAEGATQGDVRVSAYIAATGCAAVNKVKIFYSNNGSFRNGEGYKSASVEKTLASPIASNTHVCAEDLYLTASEVSAVVGKGETLYVRVKAINASSVSSPYSDVAKLTYQYNKFITSNQTIADATACEGRHEFKWTGEGGMFNPVPDGYTVKYDNSSGDDASSEFTLVGDKMVWSDLSKYDDDASSEVHTYYFTASKDGYADTYATATFTLTALALEGVTVTILENGDPVTEVVSADPWVEKTFTATRSDSNSGIIWENPENTSLKITDSGATVVFKGEKPSSTPYVIKARAANASCGRSEKTEASIMVDAITETCSR